MAGVSAWSKPGAWALDSEQSESEQQITPISDFPSLSVASTTKTKKKKPQTISLSEFTTQVLSLPTGPRERSAEELDRSKLGGGFRSYGSDREPNRSTRDSRADETDNWATGKKSGFGGGFERKEKGGFFTGADDGDNWSSKKSFVVSEPRKYDRRGSFGLETSGGADSETWGRKSGGGAFDSLSEKRGDWGKKREEVGENGSGSFRPRLNLQPRTKPMEEKVKSEVVSVVKEKGSNPFGAARPREEVLKEKGKDWKEIEDKFESVKISERGVWGGSGNGNGRERFRSGGERAWRKPESVGGSRAESDAGSENGHSEKTENGHAENTENGHAEYEETRM